MLSMNQRDEGGIHHPPSTSTANRFTHLLQEEEEPTIGSRADADTCRQCCQIKHVDASSIIGKLYYKF